MKKTAVLCLTVFVALILTLSLVSCGKTDDPTYSTTAPGAAAATTAGTAATAATTAGATEVPMTASYAAGRTAFETITGFRLPALSDCEVIGSSDLRTDQHTTACFDITGGADDMAAIIAALGVQVGHEPTHADETGTTWRIEIELDGTFYVGDIWAMLDKPDETRSFVYVNYNVAPVEASYVTAREQFHTVTGVWLPLLSGIEMDEYPITHFDPTAKDYTFDLTGEEVTDYVFEVMKDFFDGLEGWTLDADASTHDGVFDHYNYKKANGDAIDLVWHRESESGGATVGVYVNAFVK